MPVPVISIAQMREWENQSWAAGRSEAEVIHQAGAALARELQCWWKPHEPLLILAGRGHNGDDARAAAECFPPEKVTLLNVHDPAEALSGFKAARQRHAKTPGWIVDGLFGIGLNRPLGDAWRTLVEEINASGWPVAAVDVPSGLDADTGQPLGAAVRATLTVTFGAPKWGLLQPTAAEYTGRLQVAPEIGLVPCPFAGKVQWTLAEDFAGFPPLRPIHGHKGSFGHLGIVAGSPGYHGAAVLAALGAQKAQPGLITVATMEGTYLPIAAQLRSPMVTVWTPHTFEQKPCNAWLMGPGLAGALEHRDLKEALQALWRDFPGPVVADASALDMLAPGPSAGLRVLTPHPGEAARLLKCPVAEVLRDRCAAAQALEELFPGACIVLKGWLTLVHERKSGTFLNPTGNPHLAQGGSGDLLAGYLAGWLAQPLAASQALTAIRYAVWEHGAAADRLQRRGAAWTMDNLAAELGAGKSVTP
ncbi:NAD(P)H-hydrate dehydratase [Fontisphaera persica]|uniref:NAD(P)H-hydrate dehydratase n=1 Tax=Fontisphaera persica TaxID=2974023 RepID=UPI0024C02CB0|nr:NAD(P)H-hydrate dehydratase [Fontisphaera persica]WCJ59221.1 NAD(P)H-hydrate dehydratase [Fontisphaera persica]